MTGTSRTRRPRYAADRWGALRRLAQPPPPRAAAPRARWEAAGSERRRRWAAAARSGQVDPEDREVVAALADARARTGWRLRVGALTLGWLVLMTVWGFGRSVAQLSATWGLAVGLSFGAAVAAGAWRAADRRVAAARDVAAALRRDRTGTESRRSGRGAAGSRGGRDRRG